MFLFDSYNILSTLFLSFLIQAFFFIFACFWKTDKLTDLSYSLSFIMICIFLFFSIEKGTPLFRPFLLTLAVILWALRLGVYLYIRIQKMGRDLRFDGIRESFFKFLAFWIYQALVVWLLLLPLSYSLSVQKQPEKNLWDLLGILLYFIGLLIESLADWQKYRFHLRKEKSQVYLDKGLWAYVRHPNYSGEILLWIAIFCITIPLHVAWSWLSIVSPISIFLILRFMSGVPILARNAKERYGHLIGYQAYLKRTGIFLPRVFRS